MLSFFYSLHRTSYTKTSMTRHCISHELKKNETEENLTGWQKKKKNMAHFVAISLTEHDTLREGTQTNYASDAW